MTPQEILKLTSSQAKAFVSILCTEKDRLIYLRQEFLYGTKDYVETEARYLKVYSILFGMELHSGMHDHHLGSKNRNFGGMTVVYDLRKAIVAGK